MACDTPWRTERFLSNSFLSAGIDKRPGGGPPAHDDTHRCATRGAQGDTWWRGYAPHRCAIDGLCVHDHLPEGGGMHGRAGVHKAEVADFQEAIGEDMLEEPAEKLHGVEGGGAGARTANFTVGEGDRTVLEADDALVGDGDLEDIGGEGGEGGVSVVMGPTMNIPGNSPDLWGEVLQQAGVAHGFFEERAVDGCEGFDGDKEVGSGGAPCRAVL